MNPNANPGFHIFNKAVRNALIGAQVIVLTLTSAGCVDAIQTVERATAIAPTPTATMTETPTVTPTETLMPATPTATETAPSTEWQLSPDGHIYYKESELYGGMFTINKEHPEWVEKYWEDTVRGLWNLNFISENKAFINQFPTDDKLVDYLKNGGGPVSNLWIPAIYPNAKRQFWYHATMIPTSGKIDLSKIAIGIYKPTREEIYEYSPSYATGTKYISYIAAKGEVIVEEINFNDKYVLQMTLRRDLLIDSIGYLCADLACANRPNFTFLALSDEKSGDENLLAATQLLRSWPLNMEIRDNVSANAVFKNDKPLLVNFGSWTPFFNDFVSITTIEGSPITLR